MNSNENEIENIADSNKPNASHKCDVESASSGINGDKDMDIDESLNNATKEPEIINQENNTEENATINKKRKLDERDDLSDGSSSSDFLGFPDTRTEEEKKAAAKKKQEKPRLDLLVLDSAFGKGKRSRVPNRRYESLNIKSFGKSKYDDFDNTEVTSSEDGRNDDDHDGRGDDEVSSSANTSPQRTRTKTTPTVAPYKKQKISSDMSNPNFRKPFEFGWKRELVYRASPDKHHQRSGDIYYYTPAGKKIRSMRELSENIYVTPELTMEDFTFWREPIGINDPEKEIVREAKVKSFSSPVVKKNTPKSKAVKEKSESLLKSPTTVETSSPKSTGKSPRLGGFKVKMPGTARLSQASNKADKKRQADNELEIGMLPPAWSSKKGAVGKQGAWQKTGTGVDRSLDTNKPCRPCSIRCLGVSGLIPTLQCRLCLCLYHKECVGELTDDIPAGYVCKNCQMDSHGKVESAYVPTPLPLPPLTPLSNLKSNSIQSLSPPKLQRIVRANEQPFITHSSTSTNSETHSKYPHITLQSDLFNFAPPPENSKSIVGSVTTWFAPNSRIEMNSDKPTINTPKPQSLVYMGDRKFLVVPKGNVLSISPAIGTAPSTPPTQQILSPAADKAPEFNLNDSSSKTVENPFAAVPVSEIPPTSSIPNNKTNAPEIFEKINYEQPSVAQDETFEIQKTLFEETHKEAQPETTPTTKSRRGSTRKSAAQPAPVIKSDIESRFMQNYLQNLSYGYQTLMYVFQYLKVQDLLRAGCVCTLWRDIAGHPALWKTVRMKNSQVSNWEGLADALKKYQTENLDLRKMLLPNSGDDMWPLFSKAIARVDSLVRLELCRCPASVIEELTKTNTNLQVINAVTIRCETLDISNIDNLKNLQELRLKSTNGFALASDLAPLRNLKHLKHLSLTSVKELYKHNVLVVGELVHLESLDLGECTDLPENFAADVLSKLTKLEKLRLEKGQGTCSTFDILDAVSKIPTIEQLELVNFDVKAGFDQALGQCTNIKKLLIIPTYISQSATTNHMVLGGVIKLKSTLSHFVWGVTLELLRVTELFVDQCEDPPSKDKKKPTGNGDSIPVLKPVPIMKGGEIKEQPTAKDPPQVEILPLPSLQKLLLTCLPTTRIKILKIPFHATWRQSIVDTVN